MVALRISDFHGAGIPIECTLRVPGDSQMLHCPHWRGFDLWLLINRHSAPGKPRMFMMLMVWPKTTAQRFKFHQKIKSGDWSPLERSVLIFLKKRKNWRRKERRGWEYSLPSPVQASLNTTTPFPTLASAASLQYGCSAWFTSCLINCLRAWTVKRGKKRRGFELRSCDKCWTRLFNPTRRRRRRRRKAQGVGVPWDWQATGSRNGNAAHPVAGRARRGWLPYARHFQGKRNRRIKEWAAGRGSSLQCVQSPHENDCTQDFYRGQF